MSSEPTRRIAGMQAGGSLTLAQQIDNLRVVGESDVLRVMLPVAGVVAVLALAGFAWSDDQIVGVLLLFVAGVAAMVVLASVSMVPHLRNAAAATHRGRRERATLGLTMDEEDGDQRWSGTLVLQRSDHRSWQMDFAKLDGWLPQAGEMEVEAVFLSEVAWPVLMVCDSGLLWPRAKPRHVPRA